VQSLHGAQATGFGKKASGMNRREFTGGLAAAALYASTGKAGGLLPGSDSELSMTELQQQFLDLRFGMYIHLNMATYEQREWGDR
jgi:alpha-L-fucosidase